LVMLFVCAIICFSIEVELRKTCVRTSSYCGVTVEKKDQDGADPLEKWSSLAEQRIQEAMARGEFDNLPGKGKPLSLSWNPFADPTLEAAWKLLQNAGYSLDWIEEDKEIRRDLEEARRRLRRSWNLYLEWTGSGVGKTRGAEMMWSEAVESFSRSVDELNRRIDLLNLKVPSVYFQRFRVRLDEEIEKIKRGGARE
jgi:DnaJ family protein C protein 28